MRNFYSNMRKREALDAADAAGEVADSMKVRTHLIEEMQSGKKTLAEIQAELAAIKKAAKKSGKLTRAQIFSRS